MSRHINRETTADSRRWGVSKARFRYGENSVQVSYYGLRILPQSKLVPYVVHDLRRSACDSDRDGVLRLFQVAQLAS